MDEDLTAQQKLEIALAKIRAFARDHALSGAEIEMIFEMGSAAYQASGARRLFPLLSIA